MKEALVEKTLNVIEEISKMEFVKSFFLVGGTALALQIKHRLSEDLDFMCWKQIINNAIKYSEHHLKTKNLIGMLTNAERFKYNDAFLQLAPQYHITTNEIEQFMTNKMRELY